MFQYFNSFIILGDNQDLTKKTLSVLHAFVQEKLDYVIKSNSD